MSNFKAFGDAVNQQFMLMAENHDLFTVDTIRQDIFDDYLSFFPEGTNEIYRKRTEHDCSCCKHFIRTIGNVVAIVNGSVQTVWNIAETVDKPFDTVARLMDCYIKAHTITDKFIVSDKQFGAQVTPEYAPDGKSKNWNHFHASVPARFIVSKDRVDEKKSDSRAIHQGMVSGLQLITTQAIDLTAELIDQKQIYRGDTFEKSVKGFQRLKKASKGHSLDLVCWSQLDAKIGSFKNSAIGSLVIDLSGGRDTEDAIKSFEAKTAPENYQRPKPVVTKAMVEKALTTIDDLGFRESLERRHAKIDDLSVNDVLFVDNRVAPVMRDSLAESLMDAAVSPKPVTIDNPEEIGIQDFLSSVVGNITSMKALVQSSHLNRFVSLTAPTSQDQELKQLFKWNNNFAWSYSGDLADSSIKQRVEKAGGNVNALMRFSLSWFNRDDLDIHVVEPNKNHIYFGNKCGKLDVDMNAGFDLSEEPVENVSFKAVENGIYKVLVNNYTKRSELNKGFQVEFDFDGKSSIYEFKNGLANGFRVDVIEVKIHNGKISDIKTGAGIKMIEGENAVHWNVPVGQLVDVDLVSLSPNHWNNQSTGLKHFFFMLKDCKNPDDVRGIYNEFLSDELREHRKVLEVIGDKTKAPFSESQLSGLGFSDRSDELTVVTNGNINKAYRLKFGE